MITWRDDDVLLDGTRLEDLLEVDDLLRAHGCTHTVAVLASTLTDDLAAVIRQRGMSAQLHGWAHDDLSVDESAIAQLPSAVERIEDRIGVRPSVLYPPWNRTSPRLEQAASALGLRVSARKITLTDFAARRGGIDGAVINFHYWHEPDRVALARALAFVPTRTA